MSESVSIKLKRISVSDAQNAYCCMTEVPTPWPDALCQCRDWISKNIGRYLDGYHLHVEDQGVVGHIYFADSENALFSYEVEAGAVVIYCEWVQKRFQGQGFGKMMFNGFLAEMIEKSKKGILLEASDIEGQMHYEHYTSRGFSIIHEDENHKLLYYPISDTKIWFNKRKPIITHKNKFPIEILIFRGFLCPYEVNTYLLLKEIAAEFGNQIVLKEIWTSPETLQEFGIPNGVLINGKRKLIGGESEIAVRQSILEEL
jgi:hypothetical protein